MTMEPWVEKLMGEFGAERVSTAQEEILSHSYDAWSVAIKWRQQGKTPYRPAAVFRPKALRKSAGCWSGPPRTGSL